VGARRVVRSLLAAKSPEFDSNITDNTALFANCELSVALGTAGLEHGEKDEKHAAEQFPYSLQP
jgi:hypothetical protein